MRRRSLMAALLTLGLAACHPTPSYTSAPHYRLSTVTNGLSSGSGLAFGPDGIYLATPKGLALLEPEGHLRLIVPLASSSLQAPAGMALATGSLFVSDPSSNRVWQVVEGSSPQPFAGTGTSLLPIGDGDLAISAQLNSPCDVAVGSGGNLYIVDRDNQRIRKVDANGRISTVAGNGETQPFATGKATRTSLFDPEAVAIGPDGSLYIADTGHQVIRKVSPDGQMTTVAGDGKEGFKGDGGPALDGELASPSGVAVLPSGNLLIADTGNHRIRWVQPGGPIQTVAGNGQIGNTDEAPDAANAKLDLPGNIVLAPDGTPFFTDRATHRLYQLQKTGGASASASP